MKDVSTPTGAIILGMSGSHPLTDFLVEWHKDEYKDKVTPLSEENVIELMQRDIPCALKSTKEKEEFISLIYVWRYMSFMWVLDDTEIIGKNYKTVESRIELFNQIVKKYDLKTEKKE